MTIHMKKFIAAFAGIAALTTNLFAQTEATPTVDSVAPVVVKTVPEARIVETLIEEAMGLADEMGQPIDEETGGPVVPVG